MAGEYVMTEHNCLGKVVPEDNVGLASYTMDSHHCSRVVIDGAAVAEGCVEERVPAAYPVSYRALLPQAKQCMNLLGAGGGVVVAHRVREHPYGAGIHDPRPKRCDCRELGHRCGHGGA